jgi:hypothetical protein
VFPRGAQFFLSIFAERARGAPRNWGSRARGEIQAEISPRLDSTRALAMVRPDAT